MRIGAVTMAVTSVVLGAALLSGCSTSKVSRVERQAEPNVETQTDEPTTDPDTSDAVPTGDVQTDKSITAGTDLATFPLYPGSASVEYLALDYTEGDAEITIQIDSIAPDDEDTVRSWYEDQLVTSGWDAYEIEMDSGPNGEREAWLESTGGQAGGSTLNVFFEKPTSEGVPVTIVFFGPKQ